MSLDLIKLLRDRRFWKKATWIWVLGLFVLVNIGAKSWYKQALEEQKKSIQANFEDEQKENSAGDKTIRYDLSCGQFLDKYWPTIPDPRTTRLVILSGMSQMHTINERKPGDQLICQWLDDALAPKGTRVWGFAAPNLCNEEVIFQIDSLLSDPSKTPQVFIYGLCFDKMRNVDLRVGFQQFMRDHPEIQKAYEQTANEYASRYPLATAKMQLSLADLRKTVAQSSQSFESELRNEAGEVIPLVAARKDLNAWAQIQLTMLRNRVLNIHTDSKRPQIKSRYDMNLEFLKMLIDITQAHGVTLVMYVIPLAESASGKSVRSGRVRQLFKQVVGDYCAQREYRSPTLKTGCRRMTGECFSEVPISSISRGRDTN